MNIVYFGSSSILVLIISNFLFPLNAQIKFKANVESGYYNSAGSSIIEQNELFTSLDGQIGYKYDGENRNANFNLRLRPEFYGFNNQMQTIKFRVDGAYTQNEDGFNWGVRLNRQRYSFGGNNIDLVFDSFNLIFDSDLFFITDNPISINAGYGYQNISNDTQQNLDNYFFDGRIYQILSQFTKIGAGIYIEKFSVSGNSIFPYQDFQNKNNGWRFGPQLNFNYLKDAIINLDYRFMFHSSELTNNPSYEQWVRLVAGKLLSEKWSAFILVDFYFRNFNLNQIGENNLNLLYTPMDFENRIYLKLGYELNEIFGLYIRTGYFKENLVNDKFSYSGWNVLLGIEAGN
ncbi:MAG: hypothetical protein M1480_11470 [Bacteroidetes bacterium]|nr:hypothetical protein [Bacteroidota bacterium]